MRNRRILRIVIIALVILAILFYFLDRYVGNAFDLHPS
jgi:hypothetical protein